MNSSVCLRLERRTFLRKPVFQHSEPALLRKAHPLVVYRAILKMKNHLAGHSIAVIVLNQIAHRQGFVFQSTQEHKPIRHALEMAHR
jgi:hypothetical protein